MDFLNPFIPEHLDSTFDYINWLKEGGVLGIPTETVYGLAAMAHHPRGITAIYTLKKRPTHNPLIIHYANLETVLEDAVFSSWALQLARHFWPGPLTLLLPKKSKSSICPQAHCFLPAIAARVPVHPVARMLLDKTGPLAAPSANPSGYLSPTTAAHVIQNFKGTVPVVDGGPCAVGVESTIVDATQVPLRILRPGMITAEDILEVFPSIPLEHGIGRNLSKHTKAHTTPGSLLAHYAPKKPIRIHVHDLEPGEGLIAFGPPLPGANTFVQLSWKMDLCEAARNFFSALHYIDQLAACTGVAVMPLPDQGVGIALNDRLKRAHHTFTSQLSFSVYSR